MTLCISEGCESVRGLDENLKTNERKPMNSFKLLSAGAMVALVGCAGFKDQTNLAEPHAIVLVTDQSDVPSETGRVKKFDGLPVNAGREYRVRPGRHEVTLQFVETGLVTSSPFVVGAAIIPTPPATLDVSQSGQMSVSGQNPLGGMQPVVLNAESRRISYVTNTITVEAGWRYELDGEHVTKRRVSE